MTFSAVSRQASVLHLLKLNFLFCATGLRTPLASWLPTSQTTSQSTHQQPPSLDVPARSEVTCSVLQLHLIWKDVVRMCTSLYMIKSLPRCQYCSNVKMVTSCKMVKYSVRNILMNSKCSCARDAQSACRYSGTRWYQQNKITWSVSLHAAAASSIEKTRQPFDMRDDNNANLS